MQTETEKQMIAFERDMGVKILDDADTVTVFFTNTLTCLQAAFGYALAWTNNDGEHADSYLDADIVHYPHEWLLESDMAAYNLVTALCSRWSSMSFSEDVYAQVSYPVFYRLCVAIRRRDENEFIDQEYQELEGGRFGLNIVIYKEAFEQ